MHVYRVLNLVLCILNQVFLILHFMHICPKEKLQISVVPGKSSTNQSILPMIVMLVYNGVAIIGGLCQLVFQYQQTE